MIKKIDALQCELSAAISKIDLDRCYEDACRYAKSQIEELEFNLCDSGVCEEVSLEIIKELKKNIICKNGKSYFTDDSRKEVLEKSVFQ